MTSHDRPTSLELTFRHDGLLRLELLQGWYDAFDSATAHVDDQDRIRGVLRWWIANPPSAVKRRSTFPAWQELGSGPVYRVSVTDRRSDAARKLTLNTDSASDGFGKCLANGPADPTSRASESFIDSVARGALLLFRTEQKRAEIRLGRGKYVAMLEAYLAEMQAYVDIENQHGAHHEVRSGIGAILDDEMYLALSNDPDVRALYAALMAEQSHLYQWYMDLAKGGNRWARRKR